MYIPWLTLKSLSPCKTGVGRGCRVGTQFRFGAGDLETGRSDGSPTVRMCLPPLNCAPENCQIIHQQAAPEGGPGEEGAVAANGCYNSILPLTTLSQEESDRLLNGSIALSAERRARGSTP